MVIVMEGIEADVLAMLQVPAELPPGTAFQPISAEAMLHGEGGFKLSASLVMTPEASTQGAAEWIWGRIEEAAPVVMTVGETRARVGEPAALAWLIDKAR